MQNKIFDVDKLRVASPCPVAWDSMSGDERSRVCDQCDRRVYNLAGMSTSEVKSLVSQQENKRICVRLFRRGDGTVLTNDCPVGLRMLRKRVGRFAVAAFGSLLGLLSVGYAQKSEKPSKESTRAVKIEEKGKSVLKGVITDPGGAVISGVSLELFQEGVKMPLKLSSDGDGNFEFSGLPPGKFLIKARMKQWRTSIRKNIILDGLETKTILVPMEPAGISVVVGMLEE